MSAAGRMLERRHAGGGWVRGVRPLLAALLLVVGAQRASAQTEVVEYYGQDALGSIRIVFDASGAAIARADYEPFGELFTVPSMPGTSELPAKQFTGQERDAEASLDYFGARFLVPRTGRFSQVDPVYAGLFDPQKWNRYQYARNNPLTFVDPDGRNAFSGFCPAQYSFNQCGGIDAFWDAGGGGGMEFGGGYGLALDRGYVPGMPDWIADELMSFNGALDDAREAQLAQRREQEQSSSAKAVVTASAVIQLPDGTFVVDATTDTDDSPVVVPGVVGWKTGVPELRTSERGLQRAGAVMTGAVVLGYAPIVGMPKLVGPSRGYTSHGQGRIGGIVFGQGLLGFHLDVHPLGPATAPMLHLNITSRGLSISMCLYHSRSPASSVGAASDNGVSHSAEQL